MVNARNIRKAHSRSQFGHARLVGGALCLGLLTNLAAPGMAQESNPLPDVEPTAEDSSLPEDARFECQLSEGAYTVMYRPESQPDTVYPWATPGEMGGGWTAERRCYTISERLESYRPEGLVELQVGMENGYDVVCATTEQSPGLCKIVFTVPPGQNPVVTRDRVFENLALADAGNTTTVVNTYTGNGSNNILGQISEAFNLPLGGSSTTPSTSTGINLKPFLDTADGGTGAALKSPTAPGRSLNPNNFR
ncbi:MAG: COP23 domain-containing protein [Phormidesmis sp.]